MLEIAECHSLLASKTSPKMIEIISQGHEMKDPYLPLLEYESQNKVKILTESTFSLQGPLGTGIGFSGNTTKKILIAIQDEGITPLLDFFEFLSQRALLEITNANIPHFIFGEEYLLSFCNSAEFFVYWEISDSFVEKSEILGLSSINLIGKLGSMNKTMNRTCRVCDIFKRFTIVSSLPVKDNGYVFYVRNKGFDFKTINDLASDRNFGKIERAIVSGTKNFVERALKDTDLKPSQIEIL